GKTGSGRQFRPRRPDRVPAGAGRAARYPLLQRPRFRGGDFLSHRSFPMSRITRRTFLRAGVAGGAFLGLPAGLYRAALLAQERPGERVRVGCIGVGGQGTGNMRAILKNVVAVCDVDADHLAKAAGAVEKGGTKPRAFADYRRVLEMKDLDAVLIST